MTATDTSAMRPLLFPGDQQFWYEQWAATAQRTEAEARAQLAGWLPGTRRGEPVGWPAIPTPPRARTNVL